MCLNLKVVYLFSIEHFDGWDFSQVLYFIRMQGRRNGGAGGAAAPVALYQEGQGGQRCPSHLKDCLGEIANCQKC